MPTTKSIRLSYSGQARLRRGMAPLELVLALPILMVMLSIIFGVCSVTESRMSVTLAARNNTFEKRHTPWRHDAQKLELPRIKEVSKILGPSPIMPANGGLVSGAAEGSPSGMFGPLSKLTLGTSSERFVLGGGWDYQEIEFKKHSALTLTDKAKYFGLKASDLDAFKKLGGFGVGGGSFGQVQNQVQQALQGAQQEITARLAEIQRKLSQLSRQLNQQKQQLANLRKNPNTDPSAIRNAEQEVKRTQSIIDTLKSEQRQLQRADDSLGVDTALPFPGGTGTQEDSEESDADDADGSSTSLMSAWNELSEYEKEQLKDVVSMILDFVGIIDQTGATDTAALILAISRGNVTDAIVSLLGLVPLVGDAAKLAKLPKYRRTLENLKKLVKGSTRAQKFLRVMLKNAMSDGGMYPNTSAIIELQQLNSQE